MKYRIISSILCVFIISSFVYSQTSNRKLNEDPLTAKESLEFIAEDLQKIAINLKKLNSNINKAYNKIANNMGYKIKDEQRNILISFEILNKAEVRLSNLKKTRMDLLARKGKLENQIKNLNEDLKDKNIERVISSIGTTDAEAARDRRRELIRSHINSVNNMLFRVDSEIFQIDSDITQTARIVDIIKSTLFPAIERELPKLAYDN